MSGFQEPYQRTEQNENDGNKRVKTNIFWKQPVIQYCKIQLKCQPSQMTVAMECNSKAYKKTRKSSQM